MVLRRLLLLLILGVSPLAAQTGPERPIAVLGAMEIEIETLRGLMHEPVTTEVAGIPFLSGKLDGRMVVLGRVGIGKVNAAMVTTLLIDRFSPRGILFTGVAGALSPELRVGDLVLASRTAQHDLGSFTPQGMQRWGARPASDTAANPVYFPADTLLLRIATEVAGRLTFTSFQGERGARVPRVVSGTVLTGDVFLQSTEHARALRREMEGDAVEMEGAAVAQVAWQWNRTPVLVIRSISDAADDSARETYTSFRDVAAANSAALVRAIVAALPVR